MKVLYTWNAEAYGKEAEYRLIDVDSPCPVLQFRDPSKTTAFWYEQRVPDGLTGIFVALLRKQRYEFNERFLQNEQYDIAARKVEGKVPEPDGMVEQVVTEAAREAEAAELVKKARRKQKVEDEMEREQKEFDAAPPPLPLKRSHSKKKP
jgi:hypothetical protein